jgi:hypothetical protein
VLFLLPARENVIDVGQRICAERWPVAKENYALSVVDFLSFQVLLGVCSGVTSPEPDSQECLYCCSKMLPMSEPYGIRLLETAVRARASHQAQRVEYSVFLDTRQLLSQWELEERIRLALFARI